MENFATRLRELRLEKNLTVDDLAEKTKIGRASIYQWENNTRVPLATVVIIFAKFFNVTSDYLLGLKDE